MKKNKWKKVIIVVGIILILAFILNKLVVYRMTSNRFLNQNELNQLCIIYEKLLNSKTIEERKPYLTKEAYKDEIIKGNVPKELE